MLKAHRSSLYGQREFVRALFCERRAIAESVSAQRWVRPAVGVPKQFLSRPVGGGFAVFGDQPEAMEQIWYTPKHNRCWLVFRRHGYLSSFEGSANLGERRLENFQALDNQGMTRRSFYTSFDNLFPSETQRFSFVHIVSFFYQSDLGHSWPGTISKHNSSILPRRTR